MWSRHALQSPKTVLHESNRQQVRVNKELRYSSRLLILVFKNATRSQPSILRWRAHVRKFFETQRLEEKEHLFFPALPKTPQLKMESGAFFVFPEAIVVFETWKFRPREGMEYEIAVSEERHSPHSKLDEKSLSVGNLDVTWEGFRACALDRLYVKERKGERERDRFRVSPSFVIIFPFIFVFASLPVTEFTKSN